MIGRERFNCQESLAIAIAVRPWRLSGSNIKHLTSHPSNMSKNFRHPNVVHFQSNKIVLRQKSFCRRCRKKKSCALLLFASKEFQRIPSAACQRSERPIITNGYCRRIFCSFQIYMVGRRNFDAVHGREVSLDVVQIRLLDATQTLK